MSAERMERARAFLSDRIIKKENGYLLAEEDGIFGAKGKDGKLWGYSELMAAFAREEVRLALEEAIKFADLVKDRSEVRFDFARTEAARQIGNKLRELARDEGNTKDEGVGCASDYYTL